MEAADWVARLRETEVGAGEIGSLLSWLLDSSLDPEAKADVLMAWADRGETAEEMASMALALRDRAIPVPVYDRSIAGPLVDLCGTGGDGRETFNISTCASFVVAAAGVRVAKHGNRAATSKSGGFDVLEALGFRIDAEPEVAGACLAKTGMCLLFAPHYHPVFKQLAPVRKLAAARGSRTVFNLLGPLLNPARPDAQFVGVPDPALPPKYAAILGKMGLRRALVACGRTESGAPMDEFSISGMTDAAEWKDGELAIFTLDPVDLGFAKCADAEVSVAGAGESARIIQAILCGEDRGPRRWIIELNAAATLRVAGCSDRWPEVLAFARGAIDSGAAWRKLEEVRSFLQR